MSELIKLHVLNMSSFLYIIYTSMKLSKKRKIKKIKSPSNEVRCSQNKDSITVMIFNLLGKGREDKDPFRNLR